MLRLLSVLLLVFAVVSCTREELLLDDSVGSGDYLCFRFSTTPQTRVAMDEVTGRGTFEEGDAVGLYSYTELGYKSKYFTLTRKNGQWTPRLAREELGDKPDMLYACWPEGNKLQGQFDYPFEVSADQSREESYRLSDLMWGSCPMPKGNEAVICFRHMLFRVNVDFSGLEGTVGDVEIRGRRHGKVQLYSGKYFHEDTETGHPYEWIKAYRRPDGLWSAYISPQTTEWRNDYTVGDVQVRFTLTAGDGTSKKLTYVAGKELSRLESGKQVTVRLSKGGTAVVPGEPDLEFAGKKMMVYGVNSPVYPGDDKVNRIWAGKPYAELTPDEWFLREGASAAHMKWSEESGWYDCNKTNKDDGAEDAYMCWAAAGASILHWWMEQNKDYIDRYDKVYPPDPEYPRPTYKMEYGKKSEIFSLIIDQFLDNGSYTAKSINWFITGASYYGTPWDEGFKGFFHEVMGDRVMLYSAPKFLSDRQEFNRRIKEGLKSQAAIGLDIHQMVGDGGHALVIWGAEFDERGDVSYIYYADSNDGGTSSSEVHDQELIRRRVVYHPCNLVPEEYPDRPHLKNFLDVDEYDDPVTSVQLYDLHQEKFKMKLQP